VHKKSSWRRSVKKARKRYLHKKVHIKKVHFPSFFYITVYIKKLVHYIKKKCIKKVFFLDLFFLINVIAAMCCKVKSHLFLSVKNFIS